MIERARSRESALRSAGGVVRRTRRMRSLSNARGSRQSTGSSEVRYLFVMLFIRQFCCSLIVYVFVVRVDA